MTKEHRRLRLDRFLLALPAVLVLLAYLSTLQAQFVWDDVIFLSNTALYRDPALWREALRNPFILSPNYFRPLGVLTFMGELRLWDLSPSWFHLTNLLLHALNTTLVALLARELSRPAPSVSKQGDPPPEAPSSSLGVAVTVGLLYGLHPALVETVAFVSGRFDLLVTSFLLLALFANARWRGHKLLRPLGVGLAFLAAALSKEMAVVFPPVLWLWNRALPRPEAPRPRKDIEPTAGSRWGPKLLGLIPARDLGVFGVLLATGVGYLVARYSLFGYLLQARAGHTIPTGSPLQHGLLVARSLADYALLVVWPFTTVSPLHYSPLPLPLDAPAGWLALAASLALLAGLGWLLRNSPAPGALFAAGMLSLLPVVNLLPLELAGGAFIAERFLTFPLALFALAIGALLLRSRARTARVALLLWLVPCAATLERTLPHWRDNPSLWTWAARRAPRSSLPHTNLSLVYLEQGNYTKTLEEADLALERDPSDSVAWNNRGVALYFFRRYPDAQVAFRKAIELQPAKALYWNNLAGVLRDEGKYPEAEQILLNQALRLDSTLPPAYLNLGVLYVKADRPDMAMAPLERALQLLPPHERGDARKFLAQARQPERWLQLGYLRLKQRDLRGAQEAYDQAEQFGASPAQVALGQSAAFIEMGSLAEAEAALEAALRKAPDDPYLHNDLGALARARGDLRAARQHFTRAAALAPHWGLPRQNLARVGQPRP